MRELFWEKYALSELTKEEWESLCDGCGRCCLHKFEDIDSGEVHFTNVACQLLDTNSCQCRDYRRRKQKIPDCLVLTAETVLNNSALPTSCAYRLLAEGKKLPDWHPLISADVNSVLLAGISMQGRCVSEIDVSEEDLEHHLIELNN